jgi:hypothetical protein
MWTLFLAFCWYNAATMRLCDSINSDSAELTLMMNTHPPTAERLDTLARKMDDRLDSYALGVDNAGRFRKVVAVP